MTSVSDVRFGHQFWTLFLDNVNFGNELWTSTLDFNFTYQFTHQFWASILVINLEHQIWTSMWDVKLGCHLLINETPGNYLCDIRANERPEKPHGEWTDTWTYQIYD